MSSEGTGGGERVSSLAFLTEVLTEKYDVARETISPEATMTELGLDSLTVVELLFDVEDEFGIEVTSKKSYRRALEKVVETVFFTYPVEDEPWPY